MKMDWQPIETAPKDDGQGRMIEIIICGGTFFDSGSTFQDEYPLEGWTLACYDKWTGLWRGENSGSHDEYFYYKPTHWLPKDAIELP